MTSFENEIFSSPIENAIAGPIEEPVSEVVLLRRQVRELQETNTRLVEEKRAQDEQAMVRAFHRKFDMPVHHAPQASEPGEVRWRLTLIAEEFFEQLEACFRGSLQFELIDAAKCTVREVIKHGALDDMDFAQLVDAWQDLKYVIFGSEVTFGVDSAATFRLVHEANMAKVHGGGHPAKPTKPPGWAPPDIASELARQLAEERKRQ